MKRILVVISDEAHHILRGYKEANGYGNMDDAMDALLMERKDNPATHPWINKKE